MKYFGAVFLVFSIMIGNWLFSLQNKTSLILYDRIKTEEMSHISCLIQLRDICKIDSSSMQNYHEIVSISKEITAFEPYDFSTRNKILKICDSLNISYSSHQSNFSLLNAVIAEKLYKHVPDARRNNIQIVIPHIQKTSRDSVDLEIAIITNLTDDETIEFYYNDQPLPKEYLVNFSGEVKDIKVIGRYPISCDSSIIWPHKEPYEKH